MKPVVLIARNTSGSAFRYTRFAPDGRRLGDSTHVVDLEPVPVGEQLPALPPAHVEQLRADPERFFS